MNKEKFDILYNEWDDAICYLSYPDTNHSSYEQIVAMGKDIIPLLLEKLYTGVAPMVVLADILGGIPFELYPEDMGDVRRLSDKWRKWGRDNNYI